MVLASMSANAQRVDKPGEPYDVYCAVEIIGESINIGDDQEKYYLCDENGNKIKFEQNIQAMSYMGKRGWEVIQISGDAVYFKKKVTNDKETYANLKLVYKFGKNKGKSRD